MVRIISGTAKKPKHKCGDRLWNVYHGAKKEEIKEATKHLPHQHQHNHDSRYPCGGKYRHIYLARKLKKHKHEDKGHKGPKIVTIEDFLPAKKPKHEEPKPKKQSAEEVEKQEKKSKIEQVVTSSYSKAKSWRATTYDKHKQKPERFYTDPNQNQDKASQNKSAEVCPLCCSVLKKQDNGENNREYRDAA